MVRFPLQVPLDEQAQGLLQLWGERPRLAVVGGRAGRILLEHVVDPCQLDEVRGRLARSQPGEQVVDLAAGDLQVGVAAGDQDGRTRGKAGGELSRVVAVSLGKEQGRARIEDVGQPVRQPGRDRAVGPERGQEGIWAAGAGSGLVLVSV